jgi:hypothetical protein
MGIFFCIAAFASTLFAARRSLVAGLGTLCAIGYFYGIARANFPETASHFIFDAGVLAFFAIRFLHRPDPAARLRSSAILPWLALLVAWPVLLVFLPLQDPIVQLVGLRGNIFFLPFLLFGARLTREEFQRLAIVLAFLNLIAFAFTAAEYTAGLQIFYPHNANTEIIYRSADVAGGHFRIPSIFTNAHSYAGTMVMTLPLLLGSWIAPGISRARRLLLTAAIAAAVLGVFAAASRLHIVVLGVVVLAMLFSARVHIGTRAAVLAAIALTGILVVTQVRLQRISTLSDSSYVSTRIVGSVNSNLLELLFDHPLGNGLGGGGTSLPSFLKNRVRNLVIMEDEYARILLEQTVIGLCIWIAFLIWFLARRISPMARLWDLSTELSWVAATAYFGTGLLGIGLLSAIPQTMLLMLCAGSATSWKVEEVLVAQESVEELAATSA